MYVNSRKLVFLEVKGMLFGFGEINKHIDIVIMNFRIVYLYLISCYVSSTNSHSIIKTFRSTGLHIRISNAD